ncbi:CAP domain-containing protein [Microtetraspora fusca]|uniref:CAP domain-containing protein n=1 Tax=Microtetraspora fusca TaxID=1997 RepID=A0ABW6VFM0_MICFU
MPALIAVAGPAGSASAGASSRLLADDAFQQECLTAHNTYRARHGVPAMRTEPEGVEAAKKSAAYYPQKGTIDHSSPIAQAQAAARVAEAEWGLPTGGPASAGYVD